MANEVKLSKTQLAGLDLLIAKSQVDGFIDDVAHVANAVVAVTGAVAAVAAVVAGAQEHIADASAAATSDISKLSLKDLLELRKRAVSA